MRLRLHTHRPETGCAVPAVKIQLCDAASDIDTFGRERGVHVQRRTSGEFAMQVHADSPCSAMHAFIVRDSLAAPTMHGLQANQPHQLLLWALRHWRAVSSTPNQPRAKASTCQSTTCQSERVPNQPRAKASTCQSTTCQSKHLPNQARAKASTFQSKHKLRHTEVISPTCQRKHESYQARAKSSTSHIKHEPSQARAKSSTSHIKHEPSQARVVSSTTHSMCQTSAHTIRQGPDSGLERAVGRLNHLNQRCHTPDVRLTYRRLTLEFDAIAKTKHVCLDDRKTEESYGEGCKLPHKVGVIPRDTWSLWN
jgi:hypothetical protein